MSQRACKLKGIIGMQASCKASRACKQAHLGHSGLLPHVPQPIGVRQPPPGVSRAEEERGVKLLEFLHVLVEPVGLWCMVRWVWACQDRCPQSGVHHGMNGS